MSTTESKPLRAHGWRLAVAVFFLATARPVAAFDDGLVFNGYFNVNTLAWSFSIQDQGSLSWSTSDANNQIPLSGSARVSNTESLAAKTVWAQQCVNGVTSGVPLDAGTALRPATVNNGSGFGYLGLVWYSQTNCSGASMSVTVLPELYGDAGSAWTRRRSSSLYAPIGARSALVVLAVHKQGAGGSLAFYFDDVFLCAASDRCADLFTDGFENGGFEPWSDWMP